MLKCEMSQAHADNCAEEACEQRAGGGPEVRRQAVAGRHQADPSPPQLPPLHFQPEVRRQASRDEVLDVL